jgi:pilus assembly protein CpaF
LNSRLDDLLADPTIEEIWINSPNHVFIARLGISERLDLRFSKDEISLWVEQLLKHSQRRLDRSSPFVDATMADGSRLHVAIPDVVQEHWAINVRKFIHRMNTLQSLVAGGVLSKEMSVLLEAAVVSGYNIIVSGGTGAGKTTLLNSLLGAIPPQLRVITCEEVRELMVGNVDHVALQTKPANLEGAGEVTVRELIRQSLRMRPERLIVGEVRGGEAFDLLLAFNSGQPGFATLHANSATEAVQKLQALPLLAGRNVTREFVAPAVASAVDLIVQVQRDHLGKRKVVEILALTGSYTNDVIETRSLVEYRNGNWLIKSASLPKSEVRSGAVDAAAIWRGIASPYVQVAA